MKTLVGAAEPEEPRRPTISFGTNTSSSATSVNVLIRIKSLVVHRGQSR